MAPTTFRMDSLFREVQEMERSQMSQMPQAGRIMRTSYFPNVLSVFLYKYKAAIWLKLCFATVIHNFKVKWLKITIIYLILFETKNL